MTSRLCPLQAFHDALVPGAVEELSSGCAGAVFSGAGEGRGTCVFLSTWIKIHPVQHIRTAHTTSIATTSLAFFIAHLSAFSVVTTRIYFAVVELRRKKRDVGRPRQELQDRPAGTP